MSVKERGFFAIALSGGSLINLIGKLCDSPFTPIIDRERWHVFWADERVVSKSHDDSNYRQAQNGFLNKEEALFQTHGNLEHVASMKRVLGPFPQAQHMLKRVG